MPPQEPSGLLLFGICFLGALGLIGLLKINHKWQTRGHSKSETRAQEEEETRALLPVAAPIMSRTSTLDTPQKTPGNPVACNAPEAGQGVAKPGNAVNESLPGNTLPEEIREVLRFWAKVEAVERIIAGGKIGQTEAVESICECKRSGRPDSVYARAVSAIKARSDAAYRANQERLVELVAAGTEAQE